MIPRAVLGLTAGAAGCPEAAGRGMGEKARIFLHPWLALVYD